MKLTKSDEILLVFGRVLRTLILQAQQCIVSAMTNEVNPKPEPNVEDLQD